MKALNMKKMGGTGQSGFTIIELIVVILLLGILTATALPRFLDVTDEAHDAVVNAVEGGFATGLALFRAGWVAGGQPTTAVTQFGAGTLLANTAGYPTGTTDNVLDSAAECEAVYNGLLQAGRPIAGPAGGTAGGGAGGAVEAADIDGSTAGGDFHILFDDASDTCVYAYVGQYATHAAATAAGDNIPTLTYAPTVGSITLDNSGSLP